MITDDQSHQKLPWIAQGHGLPLHDCDFHLTPHMPPNMKISVFVSHGSYTTSKFKGHSKQSYLWRINFRVWTQCMAFLFLVLDVMLVLTFHSPWWFCEQWQSLKRQPTGHFLRVEIILWKYPVTSVWVQCEDNPTVSSFFRLFWVCLKN